MSWLTKNVTRKRVRKLTKAAVGVIALTASEEALLDGSLILDLVQIVSRLLN